MKIILLLLLLATFVGCTRNQADPTPTQATKDPATLEADEKWRKVLTPEQYAVMREQGTEPPFTGKYDAFFQPGTYLCAACGQELFSSDTKFDSGSGWPAFYAAKAGVKLKTEYSKYLFPPPEALCSKCGSHLGHVFDDAPQTPTGKRFCINSIALTFIPAGEQSTTQASK